MGGCEEEVGSVKFEEDISEDSVREKSEVGEMQESPGFGLIMTRRIDQRKKRGWSGEWSGRRMRINRRKERKIKSEESKL